MVDEHNRLRRKLAKGLVVSEVTGRAYPRAGGMRKMVSFEGTVDGLLPVSGLLYQVRNQGSVSGIQSYDEIIIRHSGLGRRARKASASLVESMQFAIHETDGTFER